MTSSILDILKVNDAPEDEAEAEVDKEEDKSIDYDLVCPPSAIEVNMYQELLQIKSEIKKNSDEEKAWKISRDSQPPGDRPTIEAKRLVAEISVKELKEKFQLLKSEYKKERDPRLIMAARVYAQYKKNEAAKRAKKKEEQKKIEKKKDEQVEDDEKKEREHEESERIAARDLERRERSRREQEEIERAKEQEEREREDNEREERERKDKERKEREEREYGEEYRHPRRRRSRSRSPSRHSSKTRRRSISRSRSSSKRDSSRHSSRSPSRERSIHRSSHYSPIKDDRHRDTHHHSRHYIGDTGFQTTHVVVDPEVESPSLTSVHASSSSSYPPITFSGKTVMMLDELIDKGGSPELKDWQNRILRTKKNDDDDDDKKKKKKTMRDEVEKSLYPSDESEDEKKKRVLKEKQRQEKLSKREDTHESATRKSTRQKKKAKPVNIATSDFDECTLSYEEAERAVEKRTKRNAKWGDLCPACERHYYDHPLAKDMSSKTRLVDDYDTDEHSSEDPAGEARSDDDDMEQESPRDDHERSLGAAKRKMNEEEYIPSSSSSSYDDSSSPPTPKMRKEVRELEEDELNELRQKVYKMQKLIEKHVTMKTRAEPDEEEIEEDSEEERSDEPEKKKKDKKVVKNARKDKSSDEEKAKKRVVIPPSSSRTVPFAYTAKKSDDSKVKLVPKKGASSKSTSLYTDDLKSNFDKPSEPSEKVNPRLGNKPCSRYVEELHEDGQAWGSVCKFCKQMVDQHQRQPPSLNVQVKGNGNGKGNGLVKDANLYPRFGEKREVKEKVYDVPAEFLSQFEITADLAELEEAARIKMLIMRIDNAADRAWCQQRFNGQAFTWKTVKELFEKKFTPVSQKQQAINKITHMQQKKDEDVKRFISRYNQKLILAGRDVESTDDRDKQDFEAALHKDIYEELVDLKRTKGLLGSEDIELTTIQALAEIAERNLLLVKHTHRDAVKPSKSSKKDDDEDSGDKKGKKDNKKDEEEDDKKSEGKKDGKKNKKKSSGKGKKKEEVIDDEKIVTEQPKTVTRTSKWCTHCKRPTHNTEDCYYLNDINANAKVSMVTVQPAVSVAQPMRSGGLPYVDQKANVTDMVGLQPPNTGTMKEQRRYTNPNEFRANPNDPTQVERWQRMQNTLCYACQQYGHMARSCPQRMNAYGMNQSSAAQNIPMMAQPARMYQTGTFPKPTGRPMGQAQQIAVVEAEDEETKVGVNQLSLPLEKMTEEVRQLINDTKSKTMKAKVIVQLVNGGTRNYSVLIDTGSEISTVRTEVVQELGIRIKEPQRVQYLSMADPSHRVKRQGTVDLLLDVKFLSGNRPSIMMEKEFEVMNGSYDFLFGVDVIPELYPEYSDFFLTEMFDRRQQPMLSRPIMFTEEQRNQIHEAKGVNQQSKKKQVEQKDGNNDEWNEEMPHICRVEIVNEEGIKERIMPVFEQNMKMNEYYGKEREIVRVEKNDQIGPANHPIQMTVEQLKRTVIPMDKDTYLDEAFQTIRNQLMEDGIGDVLSSEVPDKPEASTTSASEVLYSKHRKRIEKAIKSLVEASEKCVGYCTHPLSKVKIEMIDQLDINELAQPQYKIAYSLWPAILETTIRWLENQKIEGGDNSCKVNNPLLPVARKDEKGTMTAVRCCLDLRKHNAQLKTDDKYELPNIPEMLRKLGQKKIFAEMDLSEAFTQFEVEKDSRKWLTFRWLGQCYQFRCMPFGWKPAPGVFQRFITTILADMPFVDPFIDNLSIASDTFEEHEKHLKAVIERLLQWNLKLKPGATKVCHSQLKILGHLISKDGIGMDPAKVMTIKTWELPKDIANLRAFLGFAGFLMDHVRHFADIAAPLYEVKNKTGEVEWTGKMRESFDLLKKAIVTAPWLKHPDFQLQFVLATDASGVGAGCVLYQPDRDDEELKMTPNNIVGIYSHKFTESQRRYSTYKKELFAIVLGLRRFHQYLFLRQFVVITDHKPLEYLLKNRDIPPSLQQWTDVLLNYQFTVRHRPGVLHVLPDALSRMYIAAYDDNSTWGVGSRERLNEVAEKILPNSDKVDKKIFEDNIMLSTTEIERRDRKLRKEQGTAEERVKVMLIEIENQIKGDEEEKASDNETVMFMQQIQDDSLQAGPLLCSVKATYDLDDSDWYEEVRSRMKGIKTYDEHQEQVIRVTGQAKSVNEIATGIHALEVEQQPRNVIYVGNNDDEASSSTDNQDKMAMDIEKETKSNDDEKETEKKTKKLTDEERLLVAMEKKGLKLPPTSDRQALIQRQHEKGHFGRDVTYEAIMKQGYWWPRLRRDIENVVSDCDRCLSYTITKRRYHPARTVIANRPGDQYAVDILTLPPSRKGYTKMLVLVDVLTRFAVFWPLKNESAEEVAKTLLRIFSFLGPCKILQSDHGPSFVNEVMRAFCKLLRVSQRFVTEYHPEANGIVERPNWTIIQMISKITEGEGADWPEITPYLQIVYNDHVARGSGLSMFFLMMGREMNEFQDYRGERPLNPDEIEDSIDTLKKNWEKMLSVIYPAVTLRQQGVSEKYLKRLDQVRKLVLADPLPIGTLVMVRDHRWIMNPASKPKLTSIYYPGKYRIIGNEHGAYTLENADDGQKLERKCTIDMLKRITGPNVIARYRDRDEEESYEVEEILDMETKNGVLYYLLKWKGYDEPGWEPASNVTAPLIVEKWRRKQQEKYRTLNNDDEERAITKKRLLEIEKEQQQQKERRKTQEGEASERDDSARLARRRQQLLLAVPLEEDHETESEKNARLERRLRREGKSGKEDEST